MLRAGTFSFTIRTYSHAVIHTYEAGRSALQTELGTMPRRVVRLDEMQHPVACKDVNLMVPLVVFHPRRRYP